MAQGLDWRPTAAPDLSSGSLQGLDLFSRLLGSAGNRVTRGLQGVEDRANEQAVLDSTRAVAGLSAEEIQAGLRDGTLTGDRRLRAQDIRNIQSQASDAVRFQTGLQELQKNTIDFDQRKARDAAAGTFANIIDLERAGKTDDANRLFETLDPASMGYASVREMQNDRATGFQNFQNARANDQRFVHGNTQEARSAEVHANTQEDRTAEQEAAAFIQNAARQGYDAAGAMDLAADNSTLSARAKFYIQQNLGTGMGGSTPALDGGAGGGGTSTGPVDFSSGSAWAQSVGLVGAESGGDTSIVNDQGYGGRIQFGTERLADAHKAGIIPSAMTGTQFAKLPAAEQAKVEDWHFKDIDDQATRMGLDKFVGQVRGGVLINRSAIRGMAHLGGIDGARRFIETDGSYNPADSNGTRLSAYGQRFGGAEARNDSVRQDAATDANLDLAGGDASQSQITQYVESRSQPAQSATQVAGGNRRMERALNQGQTLLRNAGITGINNQALSYLIENNSVAHGWLGDALTTAVPGDGMIPIGDGRYIRKSVLTAKAKEWEQLATSAAANAATVEATAAGAGQLRTREAQLAAQIETLTRRNGGNADAGNIPQLRQELGQIRSQLQGTQDTGAQVRLSQQPAGGVLRPAQAPATGPQQSVYKPPQQSVRPSVQATNARDAEAARRNNQTADTERAQYDFSGRPLNAAARAQAAARAARREGGRGGGGNTAEIQRLTAALTAAERSGDQRRIDRARYELGVARNRGR